MRMITLTVLTAALAISTQVSAKENAQQTADRSATSGATAPDAEKKICRRTMETGTRLTPRLCLTKEEWKELEELKYRR